MTRQEQMYRLIEDQQAGNQTATSFCQQRGIKLGTFNYWLRKKKQDVESSSSSSSSSFIAIDTNATPQGEAELIYPNGVRLRLENFDAHKIRQLISLV